MYWNLTDKNRFAEALKIAGESKLLEKFMADFFTPKELKLFEERLKAFCMLRDNATYRSISSFAKISAATIARLSKITRKEKNGIDPVLRKMVKEGGSKHTYFD